MNKFLVILSDAREENSPNGEALASFLKVYAPRETRVATVADLQSGHIMETEYLFIALPSTFGKEHASRLRWKKLILIDFYDQPEPHWGHSDRDFLSGLTDCYAKTHSLDGMDIGFRKASLPIPINPGLAGEVRWSGPRSWLSRLSPSLKRKIRWDAAFLGSTTYLALDAGASGGQRYHQRVDWLREVMARPEIRFWGGLIELPYCRASDLEAECGPVDELMWRGKRLSFHEFFTRLASTRVSLTPTGHARWTYRHVESVYAGCDVVSCDLTGVNTLIPLPTHLFPMVPDRQPMIPVLERVLAQWAERAPERAAALEHFERYLLGGRYDARRPELFERFISQWDEQGCVTGIGNANRACTES